MPLRMQPVCNCYTLGSMQYCVNEEDLRLPRHSNGREDSRSDIYVSRPNYCGLHAQATCALHTQYESGLIILGPTHRDCKGALAFLFLWPRLTDFIFVYAIPMISLCTGRAYKATRKVSLLSCMFCRLDDEEY